MENDDSSATLFRSWESLAHDKIRNSSDRYREPTSEPANSADSVDLRTGTVGVEQSGGGQSPIYRAARRAGGYVDRSSVRVSLLVEDDFYALFKDCVPTDDRLKELLRRWTNTDYLKQRLLYCRPFHIVFEEPETSRGTFWRRLPKTNRPTKLVRKSHYELEEVVQKGELKNFVEQLRNEWPYSFGRLVSDEGGPRQFQWHSGMPGLGGDTIVVCRKALAEANRDILTVDASLHPFDNVLWQIMPAIYSSIITMPTVAFLENLLAPTHSNFTGFGTISDWFPVQHTTPALHSTGDFGRGDWLCVQLNMRTCIPDELGFRVRRFKDTWGISPGGVGFPLQRQAAKIPDLGRDTAHFAVEFLLSVSIVLKKRHRAGAPSALNYNIVVWLDYKTRFENEAGRGSNFPVLTDRVDLDLGLENCGAGGEGFFHFLIALTKTIDHWKKCWDIMMNKIDEIISVQLQDTLDKKRWGRLMFDDSLQLSEQYFTVLQLIRIFQNWIGETERGVESLGEELVQQCELWQSWRQQHAEMDEAEWPMDIEALRNNIGRVNNFFKHRVSPLKDRIEKKKEEVASLQDALLNASSLREALKAKTLNLYIGVFTTVTVFFTPLGFIAAFWAIPFMDINSMSSMPSGFVESFVAVPLFTYTLSTVIVIYFWTRSSRRLRALFWKLPDRARDIIPLGLGQLMRTVDAMYRGYFDSLSRQNRSDPVMA